MRMMMAMRMRMRMTTTTMKVYLSNGQQSSVTIRVYTISLLLKGMANNRVWYGSNYQHPKMDGLILTLWVSW